MIIFWLKSSQIFENPWRNKYDVSSGGKKLSEDISDKDRFGVIKVFSVILQMILWYCDNQFMLNIAKLIRGQQCVLRWHSWQSCRQQLIHCKPKQYHRIHWYDRTHTWIFGSRACTYCAGMLWGSGGSSGVKLYGVAQPGHAPSEGLGPPKG